MAELTVTYFDFSGSRGEDCRMALFLAGVEFIDRRIKRAEWMALKPETPFGTLPLLDSDGKPTLAQSNAILGYIGRRYGLYPSDLWDAARHDAILAAVEELRTSAAGTAQPGDEGETRRRREAFVDGALKTWCVNMERQIHGPFIEGERLYVADLKVFTAMNAFRRGVFDHIPTTVFENFGKLTALYAAVESHPKVAEWRSRQK